ncbi:hypothetical protein FSP39_017121 [Pinctada imbricata]|uniref:thiopurine S-methyltransferase n=1 Tax=Pinctada imbricata TaxID=66713 RepID=A0AA89C6S4_PINIB|nr:hypothetical protein FSP39_017121 [Pinctada imbricata]
MSGEGDMCQEGTMTTESWIRCWEDPKMDFTAKTVNKLFTDYHDQMLRKPCTRVLVPLCGKALEMKELMMMGHEVVGIEVSPVACKAFFDENGIKYEAKHIDKIPGTVFEGSKNGVKARLYSCDYYQFSPEIEGGFEAVWDSGGLNSIEEDDDKKRYIEVLKPLMAPGCVNLTELCQISDCPYNISEEELGSTFGDEFNVKLLTDVEAWQEMKEMEVNRLKLYLIDRKSK